MNGSVRDGLDLQIRGIFLDLDDTLVGTREANFDAYRMACATEGLSLSAEAFARTWGSDSRKFLPTIFHGIQADSVDRIRKAKTEIYRDVLGTTRLNHPLVDFVRSVSSQMTVALVTTAKRANALALIDMHDLSTLFDFAVFGDDVATGKPHPECYLQALSTSKLSSREVIAFEDSPHGIQAANDAGINVIKINYFA